MAVSLRLARSGVKGVPFYRVVAATKTRARNGKFLEVLGTYAPNGTKPGLALKQELIEKWLRAGAVPSSTVRDLIRKACPGIIETREAAQLEKKRAARKARKARAAKAKK